MVAIPCLLRSARRSPLVFASFALSEGFGGEPSTGAGINSLASRNHRWSSLSTIFCDKLETGAASETGRLRGETNDFELNKFERVKAAISRGLSIVMNLGL